MNQKVYVAPCDVGQGVFASRKFAAGEHILTFSGIRINADDPMHYLPEGANLLQTGRRTYLRLDAPAVFLNHSCNPNAGILKGRKLIALRDIERDQEIRFDYSTTMDDGMWTMECKCDETDCRGLIVDFKELSETVQAKYVGLGIVPNYLVADLKRRAIMVSFY